MTIAFHCPGPDTAVQRVRCTHQPSVHMLHVEAPLAAGKASDECGGVVQLIHP